jgi:hypothetical protein
LLRLHFLGHPCLQNWCHVRSAIVARGLQKPMRYRKSGWRDILRLATSLICFPRDLDDFDLTEAKRVHDDLALVVILFRAPDQ